MARCWCGCAEKTASRGQSALLIIGTGIALLFTKLERSQRKKMIIMSRNIWCSTVWDDMVVYGEIVCVISCGTIGVVQGSVVV